MFLNKKFEKEQRKDLFYRELKRKRFSSIIRDCKKKADEKKITVLFYIRLLFFL